MLREKLKNYHIILASGSPRRHQFLNELEVNYIVKHKPVKEEFPDHLKGSEITDYLAKLKAETYLRELKPEDILITSDTIVWHREKALGKPDTTSEAFEMLQSLSGSTHEVITSVAFTTTNIQKVVNDTTQVTFKDLTSEEIDYYIKNFHPMDKAGAYGIQEWIGLIGISRIEGSYFNVVGLPTHLAYDVLLELSSK